MKQDYHFKENPRSAFLNGSGNYAARRQFPERNQFYSSNASIFPTHLDASKRFDSEYSKNYFEFNPSRPEERTEFIIQDGVIVNPYLQKRAKGKKIVKENPVFKKDVLSASNSKGNKTLEPPPEQNIGLGDRFSKELGQHGYLKHSGKPPIGYAPSSKYGADQPYLQENTYENNQFTEEESYKREAGKASLNVQNKPPSFATNQVQNREIGSRNINRRIVENNILRNASADRGYNENEQSFRHEINKNNSFQNNYSNPLEDKYQEMYQKQNNWPQDPYEAQNQQMRDDDMMYQQYEQEVNQENRIPEFYNPKGANIEEDIQPLETKENQANVGIARGRVESYKPRDRSAQPNQSIKYDPPQLTKSVQFKNQELYQPENIREIPSRQDENRAKEMNQDVDRENVEQERYYSRLRRATQKQNAIFQQHLTKYFIPQKAIEKQQINDEDFKIMRLKKQAKEFETQQKNNIKAIQGEYSEFLSNQMKEKQFTEDVKKHEKRAYFDEIKMKYKIIEESEKRQKWERLENQVAYRDVLHEQERFKQDHPERALKVTDSPVKSEVSKVSPNHYQGQGIVHHPSETSIPKYAVIPQKMEPIGPVDANIGHKSNYRPPNPIITPVSDPLHNPYIRREVTNSLYDPKKKSIYVPPNNFAF